MAELKERTRGRHHAIEALVDIERRVATRAGYRELLVAFHRFHAAFEPALRAIEPLFIGLGDLEERAKLPLLRADLAALGAAPDPRPLVLPQLDGLDAALGALYVTEGATLGGAQISRIAAREVGTEALAFFGSYGARRGTMWRAFGRAVDRHVVDRDRAVRAAEDTFDALGRLLGPDQGALAA